MDATQLFGTIIRILNQPVFPARQKPAHPNARYIETRPSRPAAAPAARTVPASLQAASTRPVASTQAMRTLEEVRADLARLREHARRRHIDNEQRRRDISFAATDFMDFAATPPAAARAPAPE